MNFFPLAVALVSFVAQAADPLHTKPAPRAPDRPVDPLTHVFSLPDEEYWNTTLTRCEEDGSLVLSQTSQRVDDPPPPRQFRLRPNGVREPFEAAVEENDHQYSKDGGRTFVRWTEAGNGKEYILVDAAGKVLTKPRGPGLRNIEPQSDGRYVVEMQRKGEREHYQVFDRQTNKTKAIDTDFAIDGVAWVKNGRFALVETEVGNQRVLVDIDAKPARVLWHEQKHSGASRWLSMSEDGSTYTAMENSKDFHWVSRRTSDNKEVWRQPVQPADGQPTARLPLLDDRFVLHVDYTGTHSVRLQEVATGRMVETSLKIGKDEQITLCEGGRFVAVRAKDGTFHVFAHLVSPAAEPLSLEDAWLALGSAEFGKSQRAYERLLREKTTNSPSFRRWEKALADDKATSPSEAMQQAWKKAIADWASEEFADREAGDRVFASLANIESSATATGFERLTEARKLLVDTIKNSTDPEVRQRAKVAVGRIDGALLFETLRRQRWEGLLKRKAPTKPVAG